MTDMHTPLVDDETVIRAWDAYWHERWNKHPADSEFRMRSALEAALLAHASQDAEEAARQKLRGDNHWETLRSIRQIAKDGDCERIIQWVTDAGTGYVESAEATLAGALDRAASVEKVLIAARTVIIEDRDAMFDSVTVAGIASTMDEIDRPHVERLDAILSEIDAALAGRA